MDRDRKKELKELRQLVGLYLKVKMRNFSEYLRVVWRYYRYASFGVVDVALLMLYLFRSPFVVSKRFLRRQGAEGEDVYVYGETPLTTLEQIARECQITERDRVFELGCGRGRTCFWLRQLVGCDVVGVEIIPTFIAKAQRVQKWFGVDGVDGVDGLLEFRCEDMLETDFSGATVIYLYGTCYDEEFICKLIERLKELPAGTKIITVSYPLTDYVDDADYAKQPVFSVEKVFPATFTWGVGDVYLHLRR